MQYSDQSQKFFDIQAAVWDERISPHMRKKIDSILQKNLKYLNTPLLDLGSGTGVLLELFNSISLDEKEVFELDISKKMLTCAKQRHRPFYPCHFIRGDGHHLPFADTYFSTVFCFQAFPHFNNKYQTAKEIYRSLKRNGSLIVLHLMGHIELNELHRKAGRTVENDRLPPAEQLTDMFESAGFFVKHMAESADLYLIIAQK